MKDNQFTGMGICPECFAPVNPNTMERCPSCGFPMHQPWPFSQEDTKAMLDTLYQKNPDVEKNETLESH